MSSAELKVVMWSQTSLLSSKYLALNLGVVVMTMFCFALVVTEATTGAETPLRVKAWLN